MKKKCFKCKETKLISEFYVHPKMGDGHFGKCKTCAKRDVAKRAGRLANNSIWLAKERERCRKKQAAYRICGLATPTTQTTRNRWLNKNKSKSRIHSMAQRAYKKGIIKRPEVCDACKLPNRRLEKHHDDYSKPLDVRWLCAACHGLTRRKDYVDIIP